MIVLRGLMPIFISYVIYMRGRCAIGSEIKMDIESLLQKPVPRSLIYGTLRRMEKYGIIDKRYENKMVYKLNDRGVIFLIKHIETLRELSPVIIKVIGDMDKKLGLNEH